MKKTLLALLLTTSMLVCSGVAEAQGTEKAPATPYRSARGRITELEKKAASMEKQINALKAQIKELQAQITKVESQVGKDK